jgi:hypothetical protein
VEPGAIVMGSMRIGKSVALPEPAPVKKPAAAPVPTRTRATKGG